MSRYIDADRLKDDIVKLEDEFKNRLDMFEMGRLFARITDVINKNTMKDAVPVVHGRWIKDEIESEKHVEAIYICSSCKNFEAWGEVEKTSFQFCPNCGAKMDGEEE